MRKKHKLLLFIGIILAASLLLFFFGNRLNQATITRLVDRTGIWAPVVYFFLLSLTYIISPISGTPIFLAGYPLFGKTMVLLVYLATVLSSVVNFWIARVWGRDLVVKLVGGQNMSRVDRFTQNYGIKTLIFLRIFQGYLFDFVSYAYGLTKIRFLPYFIVCALGPIPWLALWYFFFLDRVESFTDFTLWFIISLAPFYVVFVLLLLKYKKRSDA